MDSGSFPEGFRFGASTAAYQIEGAARADGRSESIWDRFSRVPGAVRNGDTGDVACDHYHRYRTDVAILAELGLDAYRFSVSWPRVIPTGTGIISEAGLDFYDRLVDELLAAGVEPFLTLYHWDLPQVLEDAGGWPARETAYAFAEYASVVARRLGDRVRHFATLNEPWAVADCGYATAYHAPGRREPDAALSASHHLLVAHALGLQAIRAAAPRAEVGIILDLFAPHPATPRLLDLEAAAHAHDLHNRWFLDPVVGRGYPEDAVSRRAWSRREVLAGDMALIATPIDFLGVNYYFRTRIAGDLGEVRTLDPEGEATGMGWEVYPSGLVDVLEFVASRTGELPLYVTENGAAYPDDPADPTRDPERGDYIRRHLESCLVAVARGLPLRGYFVWSLLDNFEWTSGYSQRFGIVHVDYATQERRIRDSGRFFARVARERRLPAQPSREAGHTEEPVAG